MRDLQTRLRKLSAAVAAALIASTFIAVLPASAATITAVGSLVQSSGSGKSTLSVNPQHVGDAFVLSIGVFPSSPTVSSVSGGGSTWSRVSYTTVSGDIEEWLGAITTTGSSTITVTFSGSISGVQDELLAQEFSSSTGSSTTWALDVAGNATTSSNSTTVTMPTLSPAGSGELYVDYSAVDNSGSAGSTTGFTYDVTSEGSIFAYDPSVSSSVTPIASQSPTGTYTETAALLTASSSGGGHVVNHDADGLSLVAPESGDVHHLDRYGHDRRDRYRELRTRRDVAVGLFGKNPQFQCCDVYHDCVGRGNELLRGDLLR